MRPKVFLSYLFSGLMVACMLVVVAVLVRWQFFNPVPRIRSRQHLPTRQISNWQQLKLDGQHSGPTDAPVQIVEFFDYQCPFCKAAQPAVKAVRRRYPTKVTVIHENFPLPTHQYAYKAAIVTECIRRSYPAKFMTYHDSLFAHQRTLGHFSYMKLAAQIGITDTTGLHSCVEDQSTAGIIKTEEELAKKLDIVGIPTFIINGKLVTGVLSKRQLIDLVKDALAKAGK